MVTWWTTGTPRTSGYARARRRPVASMWDDTRTAWQRTARLRTLLRWARTRCTGMTIQWPLPLQPAPLSRRPVNIRSSHNRRPRTDGTTDATLLWNRSSRGTTWLQKRSVATGSVTSTWTAISWPTVVVAVANSTWSIFSLKTLRVASKNITITIIISITTTTVIKIITITTIIIIITTTIIITIKMVVSVIRLSQRKRCSHYRRSIQSPPSNRLRSAASTWTHVRRTAAAVTSVMSKTTKPVKRTAVVTRHNISSSSSPKLQGFDSLIESQT